MRTPSMLLAAAVIVNSAGIAPAPAQEWPTRPMTMVVPFAAGGGADLLGRILAPSLSELLGMTRDELMPPIDSSHQPLERFVAGTGFRAWHGIVGFFWAFGITYLIFTIAKRFIAIRVPAEVEIEGTDEGEFGQVCYPDFVLRAETHSGITTELDAGKTPSGASTGSSPA